MLNQSAKLANYKEYGENLLQKVPSIAQELSQTQLEIPNKAEIENCLQKIKSISPKLVNKASSSVKIGIGGEYSAGKTLVIDSLIGYSGILPVSENPTTGNVTAIHLTQQDDFKTTEFSKFTVTYLDQKEVKECYDYMYMETMEKVRTIPLNLGENNNNNILQWCKTAWQKTKNVELRFLLRELVEFICTYKAYGKSLCGKNYTLEAEIATQGLQLPDFPSDLQNISFDDLVKNPTPLQHSPQQLSVKLLQNSFSLIKRIDIEVKISKEIWDLSNLRGVQEFTLLDFPGLGAANSSARDTFLSLQELEDVQTILILLNGSKPGGAEANKLFTIMQQHKGEDIKDRILVSVGRFDQLPLLNDGGEVILDELIQEDNSLTEELVLEKLKILKTTINHAQSFASKKDSVLLLSPLLSLFLLSQSSNLIKVGTQEFLNKLRSPNYLSQTKRMQKKWKALSDKLQQTNPRSILAKQLGDFANEGGIGRLRQVIIDHVGTHGLKQLEEDTEKIYQDLCQEQSKLNNLVRAIHNDGIPIGKPPELINLEESIKNLIAIYQELETNIRQSPPLRDQRGITVSDRLKEQIISQIFDWPEWNKLFIRVHEGKITIQEIEDDFTKSIFGTDLDQDEPIPCKSKDFYPIFVQNIQSLQEIAKKLIEQSVTKLLGNIAEQITEKRTRLSQLKSQKITEDKTQKLINICLKSVEPEKNFLPNIIKDLNEKQYPKLEIKPESIFPLAMADDKHPNGYHFYWSHEIKKNDHIAHQILIIQLRQEIIKSASLHLIEFVNEATQQINQNLLGIFKIIIPQLQELSTNEQLLRFLIIGDKPEELDTPSWLQNLAELGNLSIN